MELIKTLGLLAAVLPAVYGAPAQTVEGVHPKMLAAMKRDLGLNADEAVARINRELAAGEVIDTLKTESGFAGAWVSDNGKTINVGVTDEATAKKVTAAGAKPTMVANSLTKLQDAKKAIDNLGKNAKGNAYEGVASWYVDVQSNKVVMKTLADATARASDIASEVGLTEADFDVVTVSELPTTFASVRGGDAYYIGGARCSMGFAVTNGFVTAGHCGSVGSGTTDANGEGLGAFAGSTFPGDGDLAWVQTDGGVSLNPYINGYGAADQAVRGSGVTPIGGGICRSGSTTGVHCGNVNNYEVSVSYPQGVVTGMTETTVCAEPGDSGGSYYSGDQAQGVTSGGSGNCASGGITYFQPVNEILSTYGLTLIGA